MAPSITSVSLWKPSLVLLRTSRIDHVFARAADPLFGAEAELHHPESSSQCGWIPDPLVPLVAAQRRRHSLQHAPESHPANV